MTLSYTHRKPVPSPSLSPSPPPILQFSTLLLLTTLYYYSVYSYIITIAAKLYPPDHLYFFSPATTPSCSAFAFQSFLYLLPKRRNQDKHEKRQDHPRPRSIVQLRPVAPSNYRNVCDFTLHTARQFTHRRNASKEKQDTVTRYGIC